MTAEVVKPRVARFQRRDPEQNERVLAEVRTPLPPVVQAFAETPTPGSIVELPVSVLQPNPNNARRLASTAARLSLIESLQAQGQVQAVLVFFDEQNRPVLIDGHRRVHGARELGWPTIRCEIRPRPATEVLLYLHSREANAQHESQSPLDDAVVWRELLDRGVFKSQEELARAVHKSESEVSKTLQLAEFPTSLQWKLVDRPQLLNLRMLYNLAAFFRQNGEEPTEELLNDIERFSLSARQVEQRLTTQRRPVNRPRADRRTFEWAGVKGEVRRFDSGGRIELSIKNLEPEELQRLERALLEALTPRS